MSEKTAFFLKRFILPSIILLFLIIFCLFSLQAKAASSEIFYTIRLKKLHPDVRTSIVRFASVTDSVTKSNIGKIENVAFTPHMQENYSSLHDRIVEAPHPYFYDAAVTVRAVGAPQKNSYAIGAFTLFRGATVHFFTADFTGIGECTDIYEGEASP